MKDKVELDAIYPHPPERVWMALTDSGALSRWLMPTDFQPLIGFRFRFNRPDGGSVTGKVIEAKEGSLLAYTWLDEGDGQAAKVIWTLEPADGGTRLRVEHVASEEPAVTCLVAIDSYFNLQYALRHSLPGLLRLLEGLGGRLPRAPIVYVDEASPSTEKVTAR